MVPHPLNASEFGTVLFKDGASFRTLLYRYYGACLAGQPTVYVIRDGKTVWVKPGESVAWIEA